MTREPRPAALSRWTPRLILAIAVLHVLVGLGSDRSHWRGIVSEGLWNTVAGDDARLTASWFLLCGVALFGLGLLVRRSVIATGTVPAEAGWLLLVLGTLVSVLEPASGGWALLVIGALSLTATRRTASRAGSAGPAPETETTTPLGRS
ncbi:DUF6463 family protein [Actinomadura geliboluensis]|uniref:Uncharacterized protein n=1 Tax=Actinomadura geliboluensis TaxID=882440 RepID=A0A5S4H3A4_9ACTN|nr:DUF6463 family protein [Actinomadura geliboluensis]TMR39738.1 hypothetical protein ETD96_13760 [Actinomadura geliboluensis]